ncbi:MAG: hypothetical protein ACLQD8_02865 [Thermoplasmata archaeon]
MADPAPRRVRLARPGAQRPRPPSAGWPEPAKAAGPEGTPRRIVPNRAATQRARRLTALYVVILAALYAGFALLARGSAGGPPSGTTQDLELFGLVALVFALAGAILTLLSAPAALELSPTATVVVSPLGSRRTFRTGPGHSVRIVRKFPAGILSSEPVESVEIASGGGRRTYLVDAGILSPAGPGSK